MSDTLYLLDGHSLAHRAFYALPLLRNSDGEYTNAVFGFARMLFKLIDDEKVEHIIVAFDKKGPTFRHEEYKEYKATRKKMPEELRPQIILIKELLDNLNIKMLSLDGYEADDVIGTLAAKAEKEDMKVRIVTGDRDALQLVTEKTNIIYTKRGISNTEKYDLSKVKEKYEMEPDKLKDMKGLMGDSSDNIPGVPGIGEKTAIKLLKEFDSMEEILDNIDKVSGKKRKENLHNYAEQARLSKMLGTIVCDVPLDIDFANCHLEKPKQEKLLKLLERLEFSSLIDRFKEDKKISTDDIEIQRIEGKEGVEKLASWLQEEEFLAVDLVISDYKYPVSAELENIIFSCGKKVYNIPYQKKHLEILKNIFEDKNIKKSILHSKESIIVLKKKGIELKGLDFDPLLAVYLLNPSSKLPSLEDLLKEELDLSFNDNAEIEFKNSIYVHKLLELKDYYLKQLREKELLDLYQEIEIPVIYVLAEMELNGIKLNREYLKILSSRWEKELNKITDEIYEYAGEEFNVNSPKQLGVILFEKIGLPVIKETKTGYSTSASVLDELEGKHEIIPLIKEYRQLMKLKSTYVDALPPLLNEKTGRIHSSFNQMVTATGRLSSTDPNLQNIPIRTEEGREIRKAFVPENENWMLLAVDYSQIELRVLAHISSDKGLIDAFNRGEDIHTQTAVEIFEVQPDEVTGNMRRHAKVINFGIAYGMSPYGLAQDLGITKKEAENYINKYFKRFSGVKEYMDKVVEQTAEEGFVTTILNRRRYIPEIKSRNYHRRNFARRTAINTPVQGSAADIMKLAMTAVYERLKKEKYEARILLQVHDELVLESSIEDLHETAALVKEEMEKVIELDVPLIADVQVGDNWRDKKEFTDA